MLMCALPDLLAPLKPTVDGQERGWTSRGTVMVGVVILKKYI